VTGAVLGIGTGWAAVLPAFLLCAWHGLRVARGSGEARLLPWLAGAPAAAPRGARRGVPPPRRDRPEEGPGLDVASVGAGERDHRRLRKPLAEPGGGCAAYLLARRDTPWARELETALSRSHEGVPVGADHVIFLLAK
jgi:hypothetical protein